MRETEIQLQRPRRAGACRNNDTLVLALDGLRYGPQGS
jgi:hypothetical protein